MGYTVEDIIELVDYHVVLGAPDDTTAAFAIDTLVTRLGQLVDTRDAEPGWIICDGCGASVSAELIGPDGAGFTADGGSYCSDCRPAPD